MPWSKFWCRHRRRPDRPRAVTPTDEIQLHRVSRRTNQIQAVPDTSQVGISVVATLVWQRERLRNRRLQVHPINEIKPEFSVFSCLCCDLLQDEYGARNYFRMRFQPRRQIVVLVRISIMRQNTNLSFAHWSFDRRKLSNS